MPDSAISKQMDLTHFIQQVALEHGLDLRGYKQTTLERRVRRRMSEINVPSYSEYLQRIHRDSQELRNLLNTILINVTEFFRDPPAWEALYSEVLTKRLRELKPGDSFRVWSAGCASGEEPYSAAILLAEGLGNRLPEFDIKIYATEVDDEALNVARRGEYPLDRLRRIRPDWRARYFTGETQLRISRELRRLVIFGRSNLPSDAPISHCDLVICRNVLIYFDIGTQRKILNRLHYALDPGGVLFLGKAESKLTDSRVFTPVHPRWRIFQRRDDAIERPAEASGSGMDSPNDSRLNAVRLYYREILDSLKSGIVELNLEDVISDHNEAALSIWDIAGSRITGKRLESTEIVARCPELAARLVESRRDSGKTLQFRCHVRTNGRERLISVNLSPVLSPTGQRTGTLMHCEDVTSQEKLQSTVEQLEATGEELQAANEELETTNEELQSTNEELQSTNEELETTNEELQSTNEELETTNEELQSLNEELENMNEELEQRTRELNALTDRYQETLRHMPWPVVLVNRDEQIQLWNSAAQKLLGVPFTSVVGVDLAQLPIDDGFARTLVRRCRAVLSHGKPVVLRRQPLRAGSPEEFEVHFTPVSRDSRVEGVLVMFSTFDSSPAPKAREGSQAKAAAKKAGPSPNSKRKKNGNNGRR